MANDRLRALYVEAGVRQPKNDGPISVKVKVTSGAIDDPHRKLILQGSVTLAEWFTLRQLIQRGAEASGVYTKFTERGIDRALT